MNSRLRLVIIGALMCTSVLGLTVYANSCGATVSGGDGGGTGDGGGSGDGGGTKTCADYQGACLLSLQGCFDPSGECTNDGLKNITWNNGAKITLQYIGTTLLVTWYNSSSKMCYMLSAPITTGDTYTATITSGTGKVYLLYYTKSANTVMVTCPEGKAETYSTSELDTIFSCFGGNWQDAIKNCKWNTKFCDSDIDCLLSPMGQKCCKVSDTVSYCYKTCS